MGHTSCPDSLTDLTLSSTAATAVFSTCLWVYGFGVFVSNTNKSPGALFQMR